MEPINNGDRRIIVSVQEGDCVVSAARHSESQVAIRVALLLVVIVV